MDKRKEIKPGKEFYNRVLREIKRQKRNAARKTGNIKRILLRKYRKPINKVSEKASDLKKNFVKKESAVSETMATLVNLTGATRNLLKKPKPLSAEETAE